MSDYLTGVAEAEVAGVDLSAAASAQPGPSGISLRAGGTRTRRVPLRRRADRSDQAGRRGLIAPIPTGGNRKVSYLAAKRVTDVLGAVALLILLSPVILVTLLVLAVTTRGRPLFVQERLGRGGRPFRLFKFRTMVLDAPRLRHLVPNEVDGPVFKNSRDPRITRIGWWLRSFSIDETPQLFNVLWGQMSLVGPRPPLAAEVAHYEPWQRRRLSVKPGLTCLWQVSGRSEIGFQQWMRMDIWYLEHQSLVTDLILLLQTPGSVLSRRGAF